MFLKAFSLFSFFTKQRFDSNRMEGSMLEFSRRELPYLLIVVPGQHAGEHMAITSLPSFPPPSPPPDPWSYSSLPLHEVTWHMSLYPPPRSPYFDFSASSRLFCLSTPLSVAFVPILSFFFFFLLFSFSFLFLRLLSLYSSSCIPDKCIHLARTTSQQKQICTRRWFQESKSNRDISSQRTCFATIANYDSGR